MKPVISLDGKFIVAGSAPADENRLENKSAVSLKLWDLDKACVHANLDGHKKIITTWAISPDNSFIVSGGEDNYLMVWDPKTGARLQTLVGHSDKILACAISFDSSLIVSGSQDNTIRIWDLKWDASPTPITSFSNLTGTCKFSSDGSFILTGTKGELFRILDLKTGVERIAFKSSVAAFSPKISPDSSFVVVPIFDGQKGCHGMGLWESSTGLMRVILDEGEEIVNCDITSDGSYIVSETMNGEPKVWNTRTGILSQILSDGKNQSSIGAISHDGTLVATMIWNQNRYCWNILKMWDIKKGILRTTLTGHTKDIQDVVFSLDNTLVVTSDEESIRTWSTSTGARQAIIKSDPLSFILSPDGTYLVTEEVQLRPVHNRIVTSEYSVHVFDAKKGTKRVTLAGQCSPIISPDGTYLVTEDYLSGDLNVWETRKFTNRTCITYTFLHGKTCAISPDGVLNFTSAIEIWDSKNGEVIAMFPMATGIDEVELHPFKPILSISDGIHVNLLEIVGYKYGPIIVTAYEDTHALEVFCPVCKWQFPITKANLGSEISCPQLDCGTRLKINTFVIRAAQQKKSWLQRIFEK